LQYLLFVHPIILICPIFPSPSCQNSSLTLSVS
jgi:hypothetical protein